MIKPHTQTLDTILETIHLFGDFLAVLISWPVQIIYTWYQGLTFTFPWSSSATDEDLQSVSSDESRPQSRLKQRPQAHIRRRSDIPNISTRGVHDPVDEFAAQQIWYPPPPAYEEEDHSQVRPPQLPVPSLTSGLYPSTRSPDEWRSYPDFPAAYPLSPVLGPTHPSAFRIVAPVPTRPSDIIDIDNISNSGQDDSDEVNDNETRPGFRRSLLSSRELMNPNSAVRLSDKSSTHGVHLEEKPKRNKRKRKQMVSEGGDGKEDDMNVDEESGRDNAADADEEMDEDDEGYAGDTTFTTPRVKITGMAVDSDAEMEDASGSEREDSFSFQTPLPPRRGLRPGKRTKSNVTLKRPDSVVTLVPRRFAQDARLKIDTSPSRPLPSHLAPPLSTTRSCSSLRSGSTTLSTLAGGDSLMTGDGSEREEIETPLSPQFPSPTSQAADASSAIHPPFPIPDVDPNLAVPGNVRGMRLFPRTHSTSMRSRPPIQSVAITSSSSGGSSRASSRTKANGKAQGLHLVARKKNAGGAGPSRMGARPISKGTENVPISMPIPILASDSEDARKREREMKDATGAATGKDARNSVPLNKRRKVSSTSLRKTSSSESKTAPPQKRRPTASQKPIQIARSTSFGKKAGLTRNDKSAGRATRVRNGGIGSASESGGR